MDVNKVWLSGLVISQPVQANLGSRTPSTTFELQVDEKFVDRLGATQVKHNVIIIESLGKSADRTFNTVHKGHRFMVDGYLREEDGKLRVRTFAVYPDSSSDALCYKEGLKQALEVIRKSRDLSSAQNKVEDLLQN